MFYRKQLIHPWGLWSLVAFLLLVQLMNYQAEPPPGEMAVAWAGMAQWLLLPWAWWVDRHRMLVRNTGGGEN